MPERSKSISRLIVANLSFYSNLLIESGLFRAVQEDVDSFVFPRMISHLINDDVTKTLIWHRDSSRHFGRQIGPRPSPLKLAVYLTEFDRRSGVTGLNTFCRDTDFNNRYPDTAVAYATTPFAVFPHLTAGSVMLFDGRLMHCRPKHKSGDQRQVFIFSLIKDAEELRKENDISTTCFGILKHAMSCDRDYERQVMELWTPGRNPRWANDK